MQQSSIAVVSAAAAIAAVGAGVAASAPLVTYPVFGAQAVRYGAAAIILLAVVRARRRPRIRAGIGIWLRVLLVAGLGMALFNVAIVEAVSTGEPAVPATVVGLAPVVFAVGVPLSQRRRPAPLMVAGAVLAAVGVAVVQGFGEADARALMWSVVALACEVAFTVVAAPALRTLSPIDLSLRACAAASVMLGLASLATEDLDALLSPDRGQVLAIAYLAVGATAGAFVLWYFAVDRLGVERAGLLAGAMPVSAAIVATVIGVAPLRVSTVLGTLLVAVGVGVGLSRAPRRGRARPARGSARPVLNRAGAA